MFCVANTRPGPESAPQLAGYIHRLFARCSPALHGNPQHTTNKAQPAQPHNHKHTTTNTQPQHKTTTHNHTTTTTKTQPPQYIHIYSLLCVCGILRGRWSQGSISGCQLETLAIPRREFPNIKIAIRNPRTHKHNRKPQNPRPWQHAPTWHESK